MKSVTIGLLLTLLVTAGKTTTDQLALKKPKTSAKENKTTLEPVVNKSSTFGTIQLAINFIAVIIAFCCAKNKINPYSKDSGTILITQEKINGLKLKLAAGFQVVSASAGFFLLTQDELPNKNTTVYALLVSALLLFTALNYAFILCELKKTQPFVDSCAGCFCWITNIVNLGMVGVSVFFGVNKKSPVFPQGLLFTWAALELIATMFSLATICIYSNPKPIDTTPSVARPRTGKYYDNYQEIKLLSQSPDCEIWKVKRKTWRKGEEQTLVAKKARAGQDWTTELDTMKRLTHEHIIAQQGKLLTEEENVLFTEFCDRGNLRDAIKGYQARSVKMPESEIWDCMGQICQAMAYANSQSFSHHDVKPSNIFITKSGQFKIGNFAEKASNIAYFSPEMTKGENSKVSDVWSLGVVCYEMMTFKNPFLTENSSDFETLYHIKNYVPLISPSLSYSVDLINFVNRCLDKDPNTRPDFLALITEETEIKARLQALRTVEHDADI